MKIPLYIRINAETTDRTKVIRAIQKVVIPEVVKHLISYGNKMTFTPTEMTILKGELGHFDAKLVDEIEAMAKSPE